MFLWAIVLFFRVPTILMRVSEWTVEPFRPAGKCRYISGINGVQSYTLEGEHSDDFDLEISCLTNPFLIVRSSLDREPMSSYSLVLTAVDHGDRPRHRSNAIRLDIRLINQSMPIFQQTLYSVDLREDTPIGSTVLKVQADSDSDGVVVYDLLDESPFIIDRLTGTIQLRKLLDYEREQSYRLIIEASENHIASYVNDNPVSINIRVQGKPLERSKQ
jgi:hypothetical protein